jgi:hypothetical protein
MRGANFKKEELNMEGYSSPIVLRNEEISEGVFAASGGAACYTSVTSTMQLPETGRETYKIQVNGVHDAADGHVTDVQTLTISFSQAVNFVSCNMQGASLQSGDGTSTLKIGLTYHQNGYDKIGGGDLEVTSGAGLEVTGVSISDGY